MRRYSVLASLVVLVLAGCTTGSTPSAAPSPSPEPSEASEPISAASPSQEPIEVRVTFDGEQCIYEGPRVFLDGTEVLFEFDPTAEVADHSALVVGVVSPGMAWEEIRVDIDSRAGHDQPPYLIDYSASYGPGSITSTMSSMFLGSRPTAGYLVACITDPETTDAAFFAELLTIAGG